MWYPSSNFRKYDFIKSTSGRLLFKISLVLSNTCEKRSWFTGKSGFCFVHNSRYCRSVRQPSFFDLHIIAFRAFRILYDSIQHLPHLLSTHIHEAAFWSLTKDSPGIANSCADFEYTISSWFEILVYFVQTLHQLYINFF